MQRVFLCLPPLVVFPVKLLYEQAVFQAGNIFITIPPDVTRVLFVYLLLHWAGADTGADGGAGGAASVPPQRQAG